MVLRTIKVDTLSRVEGEGALHVRIRDGAVEQVELNIFEPPRFFEAFLRGRSFAEVPDITARICGICPVAYQMSAVQAMEAACSAVVPAPIQDLRRLLYCGEWIESHALHIHMLHAPDFLGYPSAVHMARDHADIVQRGLRLKKAGNSIIGVVGGREVHPINVRVGGFYRIPRRRDLDTLRDELAWGYEAAQEAVAWTATLPIPQYTRDYEFVALRHPSQYPMNEGRIASTGGIDIATAEFEDTFEEVQVAHSTALHAHIRGRGAYLTGPLARYALNFDRFPESIRAAALAAGLGAICRNPFQSITVRAIEMLFAFEEALRLINRYSEPSTAAVEAAPQATTGYGATEAPRGLLYHRYTVDDAGIITSARIVPPTSQNQPSIERDMHSVIAANLALDDHALQLLCEQAIRNYDPCISCATHFLKLDLDRGRSLP